MTTDYYLAITNSYTTRFNFASAQGLRELQAEQHGQQEPGDLLVAHAAPD